MHFSGIYVTIKKNFGGKVYVFTHHSTQTTVACIVLGTGLVAYVPERMMKRDIKLFIILLMAHKLSTVFLLNKSVQYSILIECDLDEEK